MEIFKICLGHITAGLDNGLNWGIRENKMLRKTPRLVTCIPGQTVVFKDRCTGGRQGLRRKFTNGVLKVLKIPFETSR